MSEVYGDVKPVESMTARTQPMMMKAISDSFRRVRTPENCIFPLEILLVQDATASFQDDYVQMRDIQLPAMIQALSESHPDSTFGMITFRDKPIWSLGEPKTDYCEKFEAAISPNATKLVDIYDTLISTGGGDPSENQFGALVAAAMSSQSGWTNTEATRLVVVSTDAPPHFADDGLNAYGLSAYSGVYEQDNAEQQCKTQYYPSPAQVKTAMYGRSAYLASLVFDGSYWSELPIRSWQWFNTYLGQTSAFVNPLADDSSNFWQQLAITIKALEDIECYPESTSAPVDTTAAPPTVPATTTIATTVARTTTTTTTTTAKSTTATPATTPTTASAGSPPTLPPLPTCGPSECPPCDLPECPPCPCLPAVDIKLANRPKSLVLKVNNE